ncbi:MAG: LysE family translocator [Paracoccaceae bacterium]
MTSDALLSLITLAFATLFTPGPNNVMLASSGATFGFRRTLPHMAGIMFGFPAMILGVGFFMGEVFESSEALREVIRWFGAALMLWIAWKLATAGGISAANGTARPMRLYESAAFQWVNPKAWAMIIAVTSQFVTADNASAVIPTITLVFFLLGLTSTILWAGFGAALTHWLKSPVRLAWFNRTMALLIVASVAVLFSG